MRFHVPGPAAAADRGLAKSPDVCLGVICRVSHVDGDSNIRIKLIGAGASAKQADFFLHGRDGPDIGIRPPTVRQFSQCFERDECSDPVVQSTTGN